MKTENNIPNWNKDGVWKNVEDQLHQKKKRRFLYWWFAGAASTISMVAFMLWLNNVETKNNPLNNNPTEIIETKTIPQETKITIEENNVVAIGNNSVQNPELKTSKTKSTQTKSNISTIKNVNTYSSNFQPKEIVSATSTLDDNSNSFTKKVSKKEPNKNTKSTAPINQPIIKTSSISLLPVIDLETFNLENNDPTFAINLNDEQFEKEDINKTARLWWVETGIGFGKDCTSLREDTDFTPRQFRFIHTSAIGVQKYLNQNWYIKLGLAYQTVYEKYDFTTKIVKEDEIYSEDGVVYDLPNGITYTEPGLATLRTTSSRHIIHNNFIHRLSVPIEIAYSLRKNSWSIEPSIGFRFQYFEKFNGVFPPSGDLYLDNKEINERYFSNDLNSSLMASMYFKYNVSEKGKLGIKFTYEKDSFLNIFKNDLSACYETVGVHLGYYRSF